MFIKLKEALRVWCGKLRGRVLKRFLNTIAIAPDYVVEVRMIAKDFLHDNRGVINNAAKALEKAIDK